MTELPPTMRAVVAPKPGGPEALTLVDRPRPEPREGEILVRVAAAGVNRPDILQRQGSYAPMPGGTDVPGLRCAGAVARRRLRGIRDRARNQRAADPGRAHRRRSGGNPGNVFHRLDQRFRA